MTHTSSPSEGDDDKKHRPIKKRKVKRPAKKDNKPKDLYDYERRPVPPDLLSMDIRYTHFVWYAENEIAAYQGRSATEAETAYNDLLIGAMARTSPDFGRTPQWWLGKELKKEDHRGKIKKKKEEKARKEACGPQEEGDGSDCD